MSKTDDLKALREARYAEAVPAAASPAEGVCGHRGMGNKACQRPAGHAEKSHRYK